MGTPADPHTHIVTHIVTHTVTHTFSHMAALPVELMMCCVTCLTSFSDRKEEKRGRKKRDGCVKEMPSMHEPSIHAPCMHDLRTPSLRTYGAGHLHLDYACLKEWRILTLCILFDNRFQITISIMHLLRAEDFPLV